MRPGSTRLRFIGARLLQTIPLLAFIIVVNFALIQFAPGDPITALIGDFPPTPEYVEQVRREFGLDQPAWKQLGLYALHILQGNLGYSFVNRQPVLSLILDRAGATALLMLSGMVISAVLGPFLGVLASLRPRKTLDSSLQVVGLAGYALPVFWLGQLLVLSLALGLGWLPVGGMGDLRAPTEGFARVLDIGQYLILPLIAISVRYIAINMRLTRSGMLEALRSDYVTAARARGMPERIVVTRHALRNALLPVVTVIGFNLGFVFSGSVLVETVFNWPGLGRLLYESITARDYPVLLGILLVVTFCTVIINLITDIVYTYLDPRIRY